LIFCYGNELKFTYEHVQFKKIFLGSLTLAIYGKGRETMGGEGRGGEGRGGEGRGGEGWGREGKWKGERERERERGKGKEEREGREAGELASQTQKPNSAYRLSELKNRSLRHCEVGKCSFHVLSVPIAPLS
jgi:hypothetical protein